MLRPFDTKWERYASQARHILGSPACEASHTKDFSAHFVSSGPGVGVVRLHSPTRIPAGSPHNPHDNPTSQL
jgi:hypothetical protein